VGFNKRYINLERTLVALKENNLKGYYGKSDMLIFEDEVSSIAYNLFKSGKKDEEILSIINKNMEEKTNEVY
jgi:hypothetical protein